LEAEGNIDHKIKKWEIFDDPKNEFISENQEK
jgi:hypothetical protein